MQTPVNPIKAAMRDGRVQVGLFLAMASPIAAEAASHAGYDWLLIDGEHAPNDVPVILSQVQAMASGGTAPVVRLPVGDTRIVKQVLDLGVQTLLIPMVDSAEHAAAMVRAVRYPPHGIRGVGAMQSRASGYGGNAAYTHEANDQICLMVQAETRAALDDIEAIAGTEGVDAVFFGPSDLAASMGHLGEPDHPEVQEAIDGAVATVRAAGKAVGMITFDPARIPALVARGGTFLAVGGDVSLMARAMRDLAKTARDAAG